jgi:hypothetical protein
MEKQDMTDEEIDSLWLTRPSIHDGDLTLQLRDFARAVESAVRAAAPAVQAPVAYQRLDNGKWVECSYFVACGFDGKMSRNCRALYAAAPTAAQPNEPVEPCPCGEDRPEPTCTNRHQCWEPCGELGKSEEHARAVGVALPREPDQKGGA